jgi:hypothetical protein
MASCSTKSSKTLSYRGKKYCCKGKTFEVGKGKKARKVARVVCVVKGKARKSRTAAARKADRLVQKQEAAMWAEHDR